MPLSSYIERHRETIREVSARHGGRNVRVFGSFARGEAKPGSDIDILIELEKGRSLIDVIAIKQDLEDLLHRKVDVLTEAAISPYIREAVLKEATAL